MIARRSGGSCRGPGRPRNPCCGVTPGGGRPDRNRPRTGDPHTYGISARGMDTDPTFGTAGATIRVMTVKPDRREMTQPSELVVRAQDGDRDAFADLMRQVSGPRLCCLFRPDGESRGR
ncbi:MAG: hypothetical protein MZV70_30155 [Desulfobacterales bacterium]|nr:hypothetical protein [Desulfobacterales bacterium]